ncbi:2-oxoadipate dioxygenase/decarboxylase family protein [Novosphingobium sp. M1R2S20]|uniref:2-oxoadipate dioxygenase/decarboxylase n=1 Tax=Novosphingobium rhizovicinum TaxID=3228928 RepID=A0ABV3R8I1_9SPHN
MAGRTTIARLLGSAVGEIRAERGLHTLELPSSLLTREEPVSREVLAMALNAALFDDLLARVPTAARHVEEVRESGELIVFDHGALRTIAGDTGNLPSGHGAFGRLLEPLGYTVADIYPLPALKMTGRAYVHSDCPETIPQFFVSELHIDQLPEEAQEAAQRVFGTSTDPVSPSDGDRLEKLERDGWLPFADALALLKSLTAAFGRQHAAPGLADYNALLAHSKEAAWIATEGNAFNHATTRVPDVEKLAAELKERGYPMKEAVEVSSNGRVRQTAILADKVQRSFRMPDGTTTQRLVPGSFYEFISRDIDPATGKLDLTFDSGNATGIFAVTRGT